MHCHHESQLTRDPFAAIRNEFERNLGVRSTSGFGAFTATESKEGYRLHFDAPGVSEGDVSIVFEDGELLVSGERKSSYDDDDVTVLHDDRKVQSFRRTLKIHEAIDPNTIDAVLQDGVLTIQLSKREELQPREITVRTRTS